MFICTSVRAMVSSRPKAFHHSGIPFFSSQEATAQLRYMVQKTQDPADRYASAQRFFAAAYYQKAQEFSDHLTALFSLPSPRVELLLRHASCWLDFEQYRQRYSLPCSVRLLAEQEAAFQATYWHNKLFNDGLPGAVQIVEFVPDWQHGRADPAI